MKIPKLAIIGIMVGCSSAALGQYTMNSITPLTSSGATAYVINNNKQVAGSYNIANGAKTFIWDPVDGYQDKGNFQNPYTVPFDINASGTIAGSDMNPPTYSLPYKMAWGGSFQKVSSDLGNATAYGNNNNNFYVGYTLGGSPWAPYKLGYYYTPSVWYTPGNFGKAFSIFQDINNNGIAAGIYGNSEGSDSYAFIWTPTDGKMDIPAGSNATVEAINDSGVVVGTRWDAGLGFVAYKWDTVNGLIDLGQYNGHATRASGINSSGTIVGWYEDQGFAHAFVWKPSTGYVILPDDGQGSHAYGINDDGWIVGNSEGTNNESHAVSWAPTVPEPSQIAVLLTGFGSMLAGFRMKRK